MTFHSYVPRARVNAREHMAGAAQGGGGRVREEEGKRKAGTLAATLANIGGPVFIVHS